MLKKCWLTLIALLLTTGFAFAQVDVNKGDQIALDGIKGLGPKTSKAILDARKSGGNFKDWNDFESRVKGIGSKSAMKLSAGGLTVNGLPRPVSATVSKDARKKAGEGTKGVATADARSAVRGAPSK